MKAFKTLSVVLLCCSAARAFGSGFALYEPSVVMDGGSMDTVDTATGTGRWHMETCRGFCHAVGFSVTYRF